MGGNDIKEHLNSKQLESVLNNKESRVGRGGGGGGGGGSSMREQYLSDLQLKLVWKCFSYSTAVMVLDRQFGSMFSYLRPSYLLYQ